MKISGWDWDDLAQSVYIRSSGWAAHSIPNQFQLLSSNLTRSNLPCVFYSHHYWTLSLYPTTCAIDRHTNLMQSFKIIKISFSRICSKIGEICDIQTELRFFSLTGKVGLGRFQRHYLAITIQTSELFGQYCHQKTPHISFFF